MPPLDPSLLQALTDALNRTITAADARAKADKDAAEEDKKRQKADKDANKAKADSTAAFNKIVSAGKSVAKEFLDIAAAGAQLSSTLGISLTRGTQLELNNRKALLSQIFRVETDSIASMKDLRAAQDAFTNTLGGAREGMEISAQGAIDFANQLKTASGGAFTLTAGAMQAMVTAGIGGAQGLETFRKATGLRSISEQRFTQLVNKNSLSFMLYGPRFAKAAQEAEKLGISLASVQSAQESMVTNLDGTMDTVAQINQLGGQIDFGTLTRINEFEGPQATLRYLQSTIPPALFQSASTRALLKGFGISTEDLMKRQNSVQSSAANQLERQFTRLEQPTSKLAEAMATLNQYVQLIKESFGPILMAIASLGVALFGISKINIKSVLEKFPLLSKFGEGAAKMGPLTAAETAAVASRAAFMRVGPIAALLSGIGGFTAAKREGADTKTALATGSVRSVSTLLGAGLGSFLIPLIGPLGPMLGGIIGAMLGDLFSRFIPKSIIDTVADLFGDIAKVFKEWVNSIGEVFSAIKKLFAAITSENSKLAPVFKVLGAILGGVVGMVITVVGGIIDVIIRAATALMKISAFGINKLASWIGGGATPPTTTGNDVISKSGYGERTLVTPEGSVSLNNRDTVVAYADDMISGIKTLSYGTIANKMSTSNKDSDLISKINDLITTMQNADTIISINNTTQRASRLNLVGVNFRNDVR